jgi:hypothetical protein
MSSNVLRMYVIYDRPRDYPGGFLVRLWCVRGDGLLAPGKLLGYDLSTLDDARKLLPAGLYNLGREHTDDPKIIEVWV